MNKKLSNESVYISCLVSLTCIFLAKQIFCVSQTDWLMKLLNMAELPFQLIVVLLFLHSIFRNHSYTWSELKWMVCCGAAILLIYLVSGYGALFNAFVLMVAAQNCSFKKIITALRKTYVWMTLVTVALYVLGLSDAGIQRRGYITLGFIATNAAGEKALIIVLLSIIENAMEPQKNGRKKLALLSVFMAVVVFFGVNNRAVTVFLLAIPAIMSLVDRVMKTKIGLKVLKIIVAIVPICGLVFTLVTAFLYPYSSIVQKLNSLLNTRIYLNYHNIMMHGIKLIASGVSISSGYDMIDPVTGAFSTYNTIDNSYACLLVEMGIIAAVVYCLAHVMLTKKVFKTHNLALVTAILVLGVYGIMESSLLTIFVNIPFLFMLAPRKINTHAQPYVFWEDCEKLMCDLRLGCKRYGNILLEKVRAVVSDRQ